MRQGSGDSETVNGVLRQFLSTRCTRSTRACCLSAWRLQGGSMELPKAEASRSGRRDSFLFPMTCFADI